MTRFDRSIKIAPSILSADFANFGAECEAIEAQGCDWVHVDVMDGHFVPNLTIGPPVIAAVRAATRLPLDVHLMIANPDPYLADYAAAGADLIGVHAEACVHLHRTVQAIRALGKRACVAYNPATPIDGVVYVLDQLAMVLVMTVNPGFGGQSFLPETLPKIAALRRLIDERGLAVDVEVDGGIKAGNADQVARAGANVLVSGSGVFAAGDYAAAIGALRERAEEAGRASS
jgi:ribulose-phosphate 3-epimerase